MSGDPTGVAIVGLGAVSEMHFEAYALPGSGVRVVAACDLNPARREWAQASQGVETVVEDLEALLRVPGWEAAVLATPSHIRAEPLRALIDAGKSVLVEKPFADSARQATEFVDYAESHGVVLAVNQNWRHAFTFEMARAFLASDRPGRVLAVTHVDRAYRDQVGWRADAPGYALSVQGVHWLDGIRWMLGREADTVACQIGRAEGFQARGETDVAALLSFGDVPVLFNLSFSSRQERHETTVDCERGQLLLGVERMTWSPHDGLAESWENTAGGKAGGTLRNMTDLIAATRGGSAPLTSGRDNVHTVALLEALYASAAAGHQLRIAEVYSWNRPIRC